MTKSYAPLAARRSPLAARRSPLAARHSPLDVIRGRARLRAWQQVGNPDAGYYLVVLHVTKNLNLANH
ncbi:MULTISPECIES: hypothetical protein [unclassified Caballeronia]|uniref:hypothetical protein n=1 Tax=unclassified Caballeronia TaxID=2646786 RepID=UPI0019D2E407|nr:MULTISPECIES: hypothetical protein [unclassified Caballeronia]